MLYCFVSTRNSYGVILVYLAVITSGFTDQTCQDNGSSGVGGRRKKITHAYPASNHVFIQGIESSASLIWKTLTSRQAFYLKLVVTDSEHIDTFRGDSVGNMLLIQDNNIPTKNKVPKDVMPSVVITPSGRKRDRLKLWQKLCFALGGAPFQACGNIIGFYISIFLLETAQLDPFHCSIIVLAGKVWDAVTDPCVGYFVNKTDTRFGKMRPWLVGAMPFSIVAYFFLWYVPDFGMELKFIYYFVIYCAFMTFETMVHVPYTSLTMLISDRQKDRDSATAFRMVAEVSGLLIGVVVQGLIVNQYRRASSCDLSLATASPQDLTLERHAYLYGAAVICALYFVCMIVTFFGTTEKQGLVPDQPEPFLKSLKLVFTFGPYVKLTMAFLFVSLAIQIVQGNLALYITHSLKLGGHFSGGIFAVVTVTILAMPMWQFVLGRIGKKSTFALGMLIQIPIYYAQLFVPPNNIWVVYIGMSLAGFSISVAFLLPWSMLPDVLDDFMLKKGYRKDAIFYSFFVFFNKFAVGVSLGLSQLALGLGGYQKGACEQPESVAFTLRMLIAPAPIVCLLVGLFFLWWYPIDEKRRQEMRKLMEERRRHGLVNNCKDNRADSSSSSSNNSSSNSLSSQERNGFLPQDLGTQHTLV